MSMEMSEVRRNRSFPVPLRAVGIAVAGAAVLLLLALVLGFGGARNISGTYDMLINGESTGTSLSIEEKGRYYLVVMEGPADLSSEYRIIRNGGKPLVLEDRIGERLIARYEFHRTETGLEGTALVLPIGSISVTLQKVEPGEGAD